MDEIDEVQSTPKTQCDECGRIFKTTSALISHKKFHSKTNVRQTDRVVAETVPDVELVTSVEETVPDVELVTSNSPAPKPLFYDLPPEHDPGPRFDSLPAIISTVQIRRLKNYSALNLPNIERATTGSAGYDLYAAIEERRCIGVGERIAVATGIALELPTNMVAKVVPRSGLALNKGITVLNTPGIIDSDYRGEVTVILINHSSTKFWVEPGTRIAQMLFEQVIVPNIVYVEQLSITTRGAGGFGSTGNF